MDNTNNNDNMNPGYDGQQPQYDASQYQGYDQQQYDASQYQNYDWSQYQNYDQNSQYQNYDWSQYQNYDQNQSQYQNYDQSQYQNQNYDQNQSQYQNYDQSQYQNYDWSQYQNYNQQNTETSAPTASVQPAVEAAPVKETKPAKDKKPAAKSKSGKPKKNRKKILVTALITFFITVFVNAAGIGITIFALKAHHEKEREEARKKYESTTEDYTFNDEEPGEYGEEGDTEYGEEDEEKKFMTYEQANDVNSTLFDNSKLAAAGTTFTAVSDNIGKHDPDYDLYTYDITLVGAEYFRTPDGYEAIRIFYDFKSNAERIVYPEDEINIYAFQDDVLLERYIGTLGDWWDSGTDDPMTEEQTTSDNPYTRNSMALVKPGAKIRCAAEYYCEWKYDDPITVEFRHTGMDNSPLWMEHDMDSPEILALPDTYSFFADIDPKGMPCKPASDDYLIKDTAPSWTNGLASEGEVTPDYNIKIGDATVTDEEDGKHIKISIEYTILTGNTENFIDAMQLEEDRAFEWPRFIVSQDGASILQVDTEESLAAMQKEPSRNETVDIVLEYVLRTDSPVEIAFMDAEPNRKQTPIIGKVFDVN